jgi:Ca2+-binding RTX toxin-like protein
MNGGRILGGVDGGDGDDTFILKKGSVDAFVEAQDGGDDKLTTAVSYSLGTGVYIETIILSGKKNIDFTGSDGANGITGNAASNRLDGSIGTDMLTGGHGKDIFVFNDGNGYDTITDFKQGEDRIEIGVFAGVDSFKDLDFSQDGTNVVLEVGTDDALVFEHAKAKDFDKHDVFFAS